MAGGNDQTWTDLGDDGQPLGNARTKAGPMFNNGRVGQGWNQAAGSGGQAFDGGGIVAAVEAIGDHGGADDQTKSAAWDQVSMVAMHEVFEHAICGAQTQHLALHRFAWEVNARECGQLRSPCAAGEYDFVAGNNLVIGQYHAARFHGNHGRVITNARAQRAGGFL